MEDVLDVYQRAYDPTRPVVCLDEAAKELHAQPPDRPPQGCAPGQPARQDYTYRHAGMGSLFLACEPLRGWRRVTVTTDRTAKTFAHQLKQLVDEDFPLAEKVVLVTDNLNTHQVASLYQQFEPAEAKRIADRLEWHYTPEHGSWLNMAEIELSALQRQCLNRRLADLATLRAETQAWADQRNQDMTTIRWQFTTSDARIKLRSLYPVIT